ncbi:MAG TPA: hypothetical protein VMU88_01555 [bacterium]|nr:hypothetical protein [bacterium]
MKPWVLAAGLLTLAAGMSPLWAEDLDAVPGDFIHERNYVGFLAAYGSIDRNDDFNGLLSLNRFVSSNLVEADGIPSFATGYGFGVLLGHREGSYAGELSFIQTYHTASFTGGTAFTGQNTAIYHLINFDLKRYFFEKFPAQPFVSLGFNYTWIDINDASALVDLSAGKIDGESTLTLDGFGLNVGAGLEIYLGEGFSLVGGAYERFTGYSGVTGIERSSETPQTNSASSFSLNSTGLNFTVGTTIAIN